MTWTRAVLRTAGRRLDRVTDRPLQVGADVAVGLVLGAEGLLRRLRDRTAGRCPESPTGDHAWAEIRYGDVYFGEYCDNCAGRRPT